MFTDSTTKHMHTASRQTVSVRGTQLEHIRTRARELGSISVQVRISSVCSILKTMQIYLRPVLKPTERPKLHSFLHYLYTDFGLYL